MAGAIPIEERVRLRYGIGYAEQYRFTSLGSKRSLLRTAVMKLNNFCRTVLASFGYQTGCAITRTRKAKKGATTCSISWSPDFVKYRSQNRRNNDSKL